LCKEIFANYLHITCQKSLQIFSFSYTSGYLKFCKIVCIFDGMVKGLKKVYFIIFGQILFCKQFYFKAGFSKKIKILQVFLFLQILKVELSNDV